MTRKVLIFFSLLFGALGAYISTLFGDTELLDGWSIIGGLVGGLFGIWLGVVVLKRWGNT